MNEKLYASRPILCSSCGAPLSISGEGLTNSVKCSYCDAENYLTNAIFEIDPPRQQEKNIEARWRAFYDEKSPYAEIDFNHEVSLFAIKTLEPIFKKLSQSELVDLTSAFGFKSESLRFSDASSFVHNAFDYGIPDSILCLELVYQYRKSNPDFMSDETVPQQYLDFLSAYME